MLILADSGILLRLFEPTDPQHAIVRMAVDILEACGDSFVTAAQNLAEFWNVCTRPATARGGLGLSFHQTEFRLQKVEGKFALLAELPGTYLIWRGLVVAHSVQGKQVHDARLAALMQAHGITHILTLNGADFTRYPGLTVLTPAGVTAAPPPTP